MIEGFESITYDLTDYERDVLLPMMVRCTINKTGQANAIKNSNAIAALKDAGYKCSDARFRKLMHIIRTSGLVERVVATSKGYWISNDQIELDKYIKSLDDRIGHITALRDAIVKQRDQWMNKKLDL